MTHPNPERDGRRCQHGLPVNDPCDECCALVEAEASLTLEQGEQEKSSE